jgi:hypothetical protein
MMIEGGERDKIIDDLLRKHPRHVYNAETLFRLNLHHEIQVQSYLLERFFEGKPKHTLGRQKATLTRRTARLWSRIKDPVTDLVRKGGSGIYEVSVGWGYLKLGYVYAHNNAEARQLGELFLYPTSTSTHSRSSLHAKFRAFAQPEILLSYNAQFVEELRKKIKMEHQRSEDGKQRIEEFRMRESTILIFQSHQLLSEGITANLNNS